MSRHEIKIGPLRRIFGHLAQHLQPHRRTLAVAMACMLGLTVTKLAQPWPLKFVFDAILIPQESTLDWLRQFPTVSGNTNIQLAIISAAILAIAVLTGLFSFGQSFLTASVGQKVVAAIRHRLYSHIQRLSHSFHDESSTGDLLARLTGDIRMMRELLVTAVIMFSDRGLTIIGMTGIMLWMDWPLTLIAIAIVPVLVLIVRRFAGEIKGATRKQRRRESVITQTMNEKLSAISVVQAFAREAYEEEKFASQNTASMQAGLVSTRLQEQMNRLVQVILAFGAAGVLWLGVIRVQAGILTPGDLLVFTSYLRGLYSPIRRLSSLTSRVAKATACGERIVAILETESEIQDADDAQPAPAFAGEIVFEDVTFGYKRSSTVLRHASFTIAPGESVALVGPSGAGKSTLSNLLLRFYDPGSGSVRIDGQDIRHYMLDSVRNQIAVVMQESLLFNTSIHDNIAYGRLEADDSEIVAAARAANAHDFIEALPDGYDTVISERGASLSGGQRQRIAIARAMVQRAPIALLDEPTASLDPAGKAEVEAALRQLTEQTTCLTITHDIGYASKADRILYVDQGRVNEIDADQLREMGSSVVNPVAEPRR